MELIESNADGMKTRLEKAERSLVLSFLSSIKVGAAVDGRILSKRQRQAVFEHGLTADEMAEIIDPGNLERKRKLAEFRKKAREQGQSVSRKETLSNPEFNSQGSKVIKISYDELEKLDKFFEFVVTNEKAFDPFFHNVQEVAEIQNDFRNLVNKAQSAFLSNR